jgi:hypothetical protein
LLLLADTSEDEWSEVAVEVNAEEASAIVDVPCEHGLDEAGLASSGFAEYHQMFYSPVTRKPETGFASLTINDAIAQGDS